MKKHKCDRFRSKYSNIIRPKFSLKFLLAYHLIIRGLTEAYTIHQLFMNIITKFGVFELVRVLSLLVDPGPIPIHWLKLKIVQIIVV